MGPEFVMTGFLRNLWNGIAMPFPALRRILLRPSIPHQDESTSDSQNGSKQDDVASKLSIGFTLKESVLALSLYLTTGILAYSVCLEKWSVIDALYFTCVCFSTVGYGDLCPSTVPGKIFTCLFGLGGIAFLGAAVAAIGARIVQAEIEAVRRARHHSQRRIMRLFEGMHPNHLKLHGKKSKKEAAHRINQVRKRAQHRLEWTVKCKDFIQQHLLRALPSLVIIFGGGVVVRALNGDEWHTFDSLYYSLVTASTIGFGDLCPRTRAARLFSILYIPLAVAAAGDLLSGAAMALIDRRQREVYKNQLERDLTIEHLQVMDQDGDGKISREEYVQFMLIEMGRVSGEELKELFSQFDRLDVARSGYLDHEDLAKMAELRGATVKRKTKGKRREKQNGET